VGYVCLSVHPDVWSAMFACQFTQTSGGLCLPVCSPRRLVGYVCLSVHPDVWRAMFACQFTQTSGRLCLPVSSPRRLVGYVCLSVHPDVWSAMFACQFTQTSGRLCLPVSCVFLEQFFARPVISDSSLIISAFLAFSPMVTDYLISNPCIRCTSRDKPSHLVKVTHILHRWDWLPMHDTRNKTVIISPISVSKCDDSRA